jgi:NitT/TauT family transport system permease protein
MRRSARADVVGSVSRPWLSEDTVVVAWRVGIALGFLALWEYGARALGLLFLAGPMDVIRRSVEIARSGDLWNHTAATLIATCAGFAIGWTAGTLLPLLLSRSARLTRAIEPYVIASMGIPKFALTPLLILWFGIGLTPKIVVVAFMVFYMIFINTFAGLRSVDRRLSDMAAVQGATSWQNTRLVTWPWMQAFVFMGLKIAFPRALSAAIVGEFLVADRGLGFYIEHSRQLGDTVGVFTGVTLVTLLVMLINVGLSWWHDRAMAWRAATATSL